MAYRREPMGDAAGRSNHENPASYARERDVRYHTSNYGHHEMTARPPSKWRPPYRAPFNESEDDKYGVVMSRDRAAGVDFGFVEPTSLRTNASQQRHLIVELTTRGTVALVEARMSSEMAGQNRRQSKSFAVLPPPLPAILRRGLPITIGIEFVPRHCGRHSDMVELIFEDRYLRQRFAITRTVLAVVASEADVVALQPISPYLPLRRTDRPTPKTILNGDRPPALAGISWMIPLPHHHVSKDLEAAMGKTNADVETLRRVFLPQSLGPSTYGQHWKTLLHVEELRAAADLERYDMQGVVVSPEGPNYSFPVPGLAENRPSVIIGDGILVRSEGSDGPWFRGFVYRLELNKVHLRFHSSFHGLRREKYNVRFQLNRHPLRRMHQAMDTTFIDQRILFPNEEHVRNRAAPDDNSLRRVKTVKREIETNEAQLLAVASILYQPRGSVPFVVFGPPGTGKTVTVVEAMRQLLLSDPAVKILACAPSNSAADLIAERLLDLGSQLFRLNAPSRKRVHLPDKLLVVSRTNNWDTFCIPPLAELLKFRVIVATCISASSLYGLGIPRGHFSHIFIDEAGQATEPEVMIPIKTMAAETTNVILSGDPMQLGPIVRSREANKLGLGLSYLDRLVGLGIYKRREARGVCLIKLIKNFRSHAAILTFPNLKFYANELEPHADPIISDSLLRSDILIKQDFPVVFHAIKGKDMREAQSPSFFNPDEASLVKNYVQRLKDDPRLRLKDEHFGVIAPYYAQCGKTRQLLSRGHRGIKVGSVEEFQGQERRVIIISAVRSSENFIEFDLRHTLGFVANPRRFNVAVTRAQALLIVVGDPHVLSLDPLWRSFMNYVYQNGGWTGIRPDWDPEERVDDGLDYGAQRRSEGMVDIHKVSERLKEAVLAEDIGEAETSANDDDAGVDKPWRDIE